MGEGYDYIRAFCLSGTLNYTRYFFKARFGRKFVVNDHHVKICQALDDVIDGKIKKLIINIAPRYSKAIDNETPIEWLEKGFRSTNWRLSFWK